MYRMSDPTRVVVADDSFLVREGIVHTLADVARIEVSGAASDLESLRETVDRLLPDVVVTDIRMPPTRTNEGIAFANELRSTHPEIGVVVLSEHASRSYALSLFQSGADGRAY